VGTYRLTLGYEYQNGLLKRIRDGGSGGTEVFWELTATDAAGRILNESLGNGVITYTEYDQAAGVMTLRQAGVGGGTGLIHATAQWDLNYNLTQRQDLKLDLPRLRGRFRGWDSSCFLQGHTPLVVDG
jgi:hypothetical protein